MKICLGKAITLSGILGPINNDTVKSIGKDMKGLILNFFPSCLEITQSRLVCSSESMDKDSADECLFISYLEIGAEDTSADLGAQYHHGTNQYHHRETRHTIAWTREN